MEPLPLGLQYPPIPRSRSHKGNHTRSLSANSQQSHYCPTPSSCISALTEGGWSTSSKDPTNDVILKGAEMVRSRLLEQVGGASVEGASVGGERQQHRRAVSTSSVSDYRYVGGDRTTSSSRHPEHQSNWHSRSSSAEYENSREYRRESDEYSQQQMYAMEVRRRPMQQKQREVVEKREQRQYRSKCHSNASMIGKSYSVPVYDERRDEHRCRSDELDETDRIISMISQRREAMREQRRPATPPSRIARADSDISQASPLSVLEVYSSRSKRRSNEDFKFRKKLESVILQTNRSDTDLYSLPDPHAHSRRSRQHRQRHQPQPGVLPPEAVILHGSRSDAGHRHADLNSLPDPYAHRSRSRKHRESSQPVTIPANRSDPELHSLPDPYAHRSRSRHHRQRSQPKQPNLLPPEAVILPKSRSEDPPQTIRTQPHRRHPPPKKHCLTELSHDEPYLHARSAGVLWQTIVGEFVRFPWNWYNGARTPQMGASSSTSWKYVTRDRIRGYAPMQSVVKGHGSRGRILVHIVVKEMSTFSVLQDIAIGCFHPNAKNLWPEGYDAKVKDGLFMCGGPCREKDIRDVWMAIRKRTYGEGEPSALENLLLQNYKLEQVARNSPTGNKKMVSNSNIRSIFGDKPPMETVVMQESELYKLIEKTIKHSGGRFTPAMAVLHEIVFKRDWNK